MISQPRLARGTVTIDPDALTVHAVITTAAPDRAGDVIEPAGLRNAEEFLRNPVVLWAHQRALPPVGTCARLDVGDDRIVAVTRFARGVPFAEDLFRLYEQGVLRGWSIGFVPRRATLLPPSPRTGRRGLKVSEWDLLEYSAVPVPENPEALTLAVRKGVVRDRDLRDWLVRRCGDPFAELMP
jgi:hypothetical protein